MHEGLILLIEGYCKNKSIASTPSIDKHKGSHSKKSQKEGNVKGKEKAKLKPSNSQKQIVEEDSESESIESSQNDIPEEEEDMDFGDFRSNLEGYPETKGKNEKGNEEDISEGNS